MAIAGYLMVTAELLDVPVERATRMVALGLLRSAVAAWERLIDPADDDALHDFRVAVRRLRSWVRAFRPELDSSVPGTARRRLKRVVRATGAARDLEVELDWLHEEEEETVDPRRRRGIAQLRARLEREQEAAEQMLRRAVARDFRRAADRLEESLQAYTVTIRVDDDIAARLRPMALDAARAVRRAAETLRSRLREIPSKGDQPVAERPVVHRARIAAKRLRYLLEPFAQQVAGAERVIQRLTQLQDTIGKMLDAGLLLQDVVAEGESASMSEDSRLGLAELAARLRKREAEGRAALQREWLGADVSEFFESVHAIAADLASRAPRDEEIERKYLLRSVPPHARRAPAQEIEQGYIPGDRIAERLRRVQHDDGRRLYRTIKLGSGLVRGEVEEETTAQVFDTMWPLTEGRRVHKRRYRVADGEWVWEIDEFLDRDLVVAEVELPDRDVKVDPPAWLAAYILRDVTGEPEYENLTLATAGSRSPSQRSTESTTRASA
jgi:CHAD domain-containing protein/CYTH domain-containing protein